MSVSTTVTTTKTLTLSEDDIETIIRKSLGPEWEGCNVSIYEKTISAGSVMGAIDDFHQIECQVKLVKTVES